MEPSFREWYAFQVYTGKERCAFCLQSGANPLAINSSAGVSACLRPYPRFGKIGRYWAGSPLRLPADKPRLAMIRPAQSNGYQRVFNNCGRPSMPKDLAIQCPLRHAGQTLLPNTGC
jgi:hypothetical protein